MQFGRPPPQKQNTVCEHNCINCIPWKCPPMCVFHFCFLSSPFLESCFFIARKKSRNYKIPKQKPRHKGTIKEDAKHQKSLSCFFFCKTKNNTQKQHKNKGNRLCSQPPSKTKDTTQNTTKNHPKETKQIKLQLKPNNRHSHNKTRNDKKNTKNNSSSFRAHTYFAATIPPLKKAKRHYNHSKLGHKKIHSKNTHTQYQQTRKEHRKLGNTIAVIAPIESVLFVVPFSVFPFWQFPPKRKLIKKNSSCVLKILDTKKTTGTNNIRTSRNKQTKQKQKNK